MKTNLKNMAWMLAATLVMAACSDSLDESSNTGQGPLTGEGYVKVAINMPSTNGNSTRSSDDSNDPDPDVSLEDGEANEYNVNNAILAFFKCSKTLADGTPETKATFVKAYALGTADLVTSGSAETPQVTEQVSVITEAPKVDNTQEQLYVLAILNYNSSLFATNDGALTVNGSTVSKLSDLQKKISASITGETLTNDDFVYKFTGGSTTSNRNQFTMTNAPLSDKAGTSSSDITDAKAYTLVPVTVYDTKAQATNGDVAKIYVERVVAKATLTLGANNKVADKDAQIKVTDADGTTPTGDIVEITGWYLNVTNNSTKLVRDVTNFKSTTGGWLYTDGSNGNEAERFAGTRAIQNASFGVSGESNYYRIYWAQDCNYVDTGTDATVVATDFTTYSTYYIDDDGNVQSTSLSWTPSWNGLGKACYCLENTMDFSQQKDDRTTGVLIKTIYLTKFEGEDNATAKSFFVCGTSAAKYPEEQVGEGSASNGTDAFVNYVMRGADELITTDSHKFNGSGLALKTLKSGTYTKVADVFTFTATDDALAAQQAAVGAVVGGRISYYKDGENYYYSSLIRHFSDGEGVSVPTSGIASADDYQLKHLGRYGVVRNNWYEIEINSVSGPGDPAIVKPDGGTDDEAEGYINCTINVLSWAKRSQGVDL